MARGLFRTKLNNTRIKLRKQNCTNFDVTASLPALFRIDLIHQI